MNKENNEIFIEELEEIEEHEELEPQAELEEKNNSIATDYNVVNEKESQEKNKIYIDYKTRLVSNILLLITLFIMTVLFAQGAFKGGTSTTINYNENSALDYNVYLKDNNFYDKDYLPKDKIYVASLIDNIMIDFKYNFNINKASNIDFEYDVVAKLTIDEATSGSNYFEKEYPLLTNKRFSINNANNYSLDEQVKINYNYYNKLANEFKQQYGVETSSNLTVYFKINKVNKDVETAQAINTSTMYVKIPLSEKSVNIELNYKDINNSNYFIETADNTIANILFGVLAIVFLLGTIIVTIKLTRLLLLLRTKKTAYDKFIEKVLNEYDRLIVENSTGPDTKKSNIIKITKFEELLDVRDNLKLPIMYYVISEHNKCCFYIKHNKDLYLMTVKAVDLEESNNKKK